MMYETKSDLPVDGEIEYEQIPTGELDYNVGDYIWREKFKGKWEYRTSDFEVDNSTAVQIWEMNDGRYFLKWKTVANIGFNVFETSSEAEKELEFIVKAIKDP